MYVVEKVTHDLLISEMVNVNSTLERSLELPKDLFSSDEIDVKE
jgi:hypothetical protein